MNKKQLIVVWVMGILLLSGCALVNDKSMKNNPDDMHTSSDVAASAKGIENKSEETSKDFFAKFKKRYGFTDDIIARYGEYEMACPTSEEEYCGLRGNAVVMIKAVSENPKELPLARVYFKTATGEEIVLKELGTADKIFKTKFANGKNDYFGNVSFWLIPLSLMLDEKGVLNIDFKNNREAFDVGHGPWSLNERNREYIKKHSQGILKFPQRLDEDILVKFLEREF